VCVCTCVHVCAHAGGGSRGRSHCGACACVCARVLVHARRAEAMRATVCPAAPLLLRLEVPARWHNVAGGAWWHDVTVWWHDVAGGAWCHDVTVWWHDVAGGAWCHDVTVWWHDVPCPCCFSWRFLCEVTLPGWHFWVTIQPPRHQLLSCESTMPARTRWR
jgi:hypothetical protein